MTQNYQFAILFPLVLGIGAAVCTIFVHALALAATVNLFRHERKLGRAGAGALIDLTILALAISFALVAYLIEIALWAVLRILSREFQEFGTAYYHSAVKLHDTGLWGSAHDPVVEVTGTTGGNERSAHVCFGRNGLCCYTTVGPDQV